MPQIGETKRGREIGKSDRRKFVWCACPDCGKERWVAVSKGEAVSIRCSHCSGKKQQPYILACKAAKPHIWKENRYLADGYMMVKVSQDDFFYPMANNQGYVLEHRLVMAKYLKRHLLSWEIIHHKNGIRSDNRLENLELLPSQYKHLILTRMATYIKKLEREIEKLRRLNETSLPEL